MKNARAATRAVQRAERASPSEFTPERVFDAVHDLLDEIDPRNHDRIWIGTEHCGLVVYLDLPLSAPVIPARRLFLNFGSGRCELTRVTNDPAQPRSNNQRVATFDCTIPRLFLNVVQALSRCGLLVPKRVLRSAERMTKRLIDGLH